MSTARGSKRSRKKYKVTSSKEKMNINYALWMGFFLSFLAAFLLSLFYISFISFSRIALSRLLEDKDKNFRSEILDIYDELRVALVYTRIFFIIAFLVYLYLVFPQSRFWPLWLFLLSFGSYLIFFDLLPRLFNSLNKDKMLGFFLPSYKFPYYIAKPLLFLTRTKSPEKEEEPEHEASDEEIQAFIHEAKEEGIIEKEEGVLLKSVVEFGDTVVREIMTPRVDMICIRKDADIKRLRDLVIKEKHSRVPIYKDRVDNIEGIVIAKDLLEYSEDRQKSHPIESLIRPVYFVPESMKVARLLKEFQKRKQKLAIVVDEHGGVSGLVTMEDLVEEIVGEIQDEYDRDEVQITKQGPFDYVVSGDTEVEEIEELFDLDLAEADYITMSGFITHNLGRFPQKGEKLEIRGLSLEILEIDQKRIKSLRVKKAEEPDSQSSQ
jgi:CBS domain containing-hemolysin-like protein